MVFVVLPALIPDIRRLYDVYFASFGNDYMGKLMLEALFPGEVYKTEQFRKDHAAGTLAYWHTSDQQYTYKVVDTDTGDIVGIALGDIVLKERSEEERAFMGVPWLEGEHRERAEKVLRPLWEMREKLFAGRKHICKIISLLENMSDLLLTTGNIDVHVIGVDPSHQGRKAGAALVAWGIDLCEQTQLPVYFESSPTTAPLYAKMGYELLPERIVHEAALVGAKSDVVVPLMVRLPGGMPFAEWRERGYPAFQQQRRLKGPEGAGQADAVTVRDTKHVSGMGGGFISLALRGPMSLTRWIYQIIR
jgi:GNAT superfamily N-acetyltransferase